MRLINRKPDTNSHFKLNTLLIPFVLILAALQIIFSNRLVSSGDTLKKLESEAVSLETQNQHLKAEIASLGSMDRLKKEALRLGFSSPSPVVNISGQREFALNK